MVPVAAVSEDVEEVEKDDDDDRNPEQPGDDALHVGLLNGLSSGNAGRGEGFRPIRRTVGTDAPAAGPTSGERKE
jgi:hypothetical protein